MEALRMYFTIALFLPIAIQLKAFTLSGVPLVKAAEDNQTNGLLNTSYELQKAMIFKIDLIETLIDNMKLKVDTLNMRNIKLYEAVKQMREDLAIDEGSGEDFRKEEKTASNNNNTSQCYRNQSLTISKNQIMQSFNSTTNSSTIPLTTSIKNQTHSINSTIITSNTSTCPDLFSSCQRRGNGLQLIQILHSKFDPFYVQCIEDPQNSDADPWMLIQRRRNGNIDFYRSWTEYQRGFGKMEDEFFIGLNKLHALTKSAIHELWIQLENFSNETRWAKYNRFAIAGASNDFALNVLGNYSGNAGDSLKMHAGQKFSTKDVDNDSHPLLNCAIEVLGGWWYNNCLTSNLNGPYLDLSSQNSIWEMSYPQIGIDWQSWPQDCHSLKYVHMAIRPVKA